MFLAGDLLDLSRSASETAYSAAWQAGADECSAAQHFNDMVIPGAARDDALAISSPTLRTTPRILRSDGGRVRPDNKIRPAQRVEVVV